MRFESLKLLVGRQVRVSAPQSKTVGCDYRCEAGLRKNMGMHSLVIEPNHQPKHYAVIGPMVEKGAPIRIPQGVTYCVQH